VGEVASFPAFSTSTSLPACFRFRLSFLLSLGVVSCRRSQVLAWVRDYEFWTRQRSCGSARGKEANLARCGADIVDSTGSCDYNGDTGNGIDNGLVLGDPC
jgi:hypothetical protein